MVAQGSKSDSNALLIIGGTTLIYGLFGLVIGCTLMNSVILASFGFCVGVLAVALR